MTHQPDAAHSGIELTPLGEAYALGHLRPSGCPAGIDPNEWRQALERRVDQHLSLVTTLLAVLDAMDGEPDLEPSVGFDEREGDACDYGELDRADDEPSLGAPEIAPMDLIPGPLSRGGWQWRQGNQERWAKGAQDDGEQDGGDEPEAVNEDGGDIQDEPHDEEPDREPDETDCMTTEWTPERPAEEVVWGHEYTRAKAGHTERRKLLRAAGTGHQGHFHGLILAKLPERYRMQVEGDCLSPEIPTGACLEFSTSEKPSAGDFVAIYRWAQYVGPGEWQVVVKKLVTDWRGGEVTPVIFREGKPISVGPCLEVAMLNPPRRLYYPEQQIEAVHKVMRIVPDVERGAKSSAAELLAIELSDGAVS